MSHTRVWPDAIPPHRAIAVPGLHVYTDRLSVEAGQQIGFHVSSTLPYDFSVRQLGPDVDDDTQDKVLHAELSQLAALQPIHPGSYIAVAEGLANEPLHEFSLECWVNPWDFGDPQTVMSQCDLPHQPGFALEIDSSGAPMFRCGNATLTAGPLASRQWVHLAGTFLRGSMALFVDGEQVAVTSGPTHCVPALAPLRIGAAGWLGMADHFLDADLAMPAIHGRCLSAEAVRARWSDGAQQPPTDERLLACWPLREQRGDVVADISAFARTGRLVNHGTWMVPGPRFDPTRVPRFGNVFAYDPVSDDRRGHALRLASDDLMDCRWTQTHSVKLPVEARPGVYVGCFDALQDGESFAYEVSFIVKRAAASAPATFVVLCATNTWLAYRASPFARNLAGPASWPRQGKGLPNAHPLAPDYNLYTTHRKGQPTYHLGLRVPRPNASPRALYAPERSGFSQWVRLERHLHTWLDRQGYVYDVVTDLDLDRDPALLQPYRTVIVNGHSEYWSAPAREGLDAYLRRGGSAIVLSGNSMYWRVSFDADGLVMEQRKTNTPMCDEEAPSGRIAAPGGVHGEQYHAHDGRRGGLWRFAGGSSSEVIGLETAGWGFADAEDFGVYRVKESDHFLFNGPLPTGLARGESFGHGPDGSLPRAVGHEWDLSIRTLRRMTGKPPIGSELPADASGMVVLAEGIRHVPGRLDAYLDFFERPTTSLDGLSAEMIYWERPQGGRVFNAAAVGASWVLHADPAFAALLANVLAHFGVPATAPHRTARALDEEHQARI